MKTVYLSLGSNLGDREANLERALEALSASGVRITKRSSIYETAPQNMTDQPWFLNMVIEGRTEQSVCQLLETIQKIERELGRVRSATAIPKGPRTIDIDILLAGDETIATPKLTVPHEHMLDRRFVLEPLLEIAPGLRDPRTGEPLKNDLRAVVHQPARKIPS